MEKFCFWFVKIHIKKTFTFKQQSSYLTNSSLVVNTYSCIDLIGYCSWGWWTFVYCEHCSLVKKTGREIWTWLSVNNVLPSVYFVRSNCQLSNVSICLLLPKEPCLFFCYSCSNAFSCPEQLPTSHLEDWDLDFQVVLVPSGGATSVQMKLFSPPEMDQTKKCYGLNKLLQTWLVWMHSATVSLYSVCHLWYHFICAGFLPV